MIEERLVGRCAIEDVEMSATSVETGEEKDACYDL